MASKPKKTTTKPKTGGQVEQFQQQSGGAPPPGKNTKRTPIGVPKDYTAQTQFVGTPVGSIPWDQFQDKKTGQMSSTATVKPFYYAGDEMKPAYEMSPQQITRLQQSLINANLLKPNANYTPGSWDPATSSAYKTLLSMANAKGVDWTIALADQLQSSGGQPVATQRAPLVVKVASPDDIKSVANNVAQTLYGGNLDEGSMQQLIQSYQQLQSQAQTSNYNAGDQAAFGGAPGGGGQVTQAPDATNYAEQFIRQHFPTQVATTTLGGDQKTVLDILTAHQPGGGQ